jgi:alkylation response protein AidB-like acyl-CoA dehydrogenase
MKFEFTGEHESLRTLVAEICSGGSHSRASYDGTTVIDSALWRTISSAGLTGVALPQDCEGGGAGPVELALIAEELGGHAAAVPFTEHALTGEAITTLGSEEQHERYLVPLARGATIGAIALPQRANCVMARREGAAYRLAGMLALVPNAAAADLVVLPAVLDDEVRWFVTESARISSLPTMALKPTYCREPRRHNGSRNCWALSPQPKPLARRPRHWRPPHSTRPSGTSLDCRSAPSKRSSIALPTCSSP